MAISAGEWLQAVSNIVGVALTILATLWLERFLRDRRTRRAVRDSLREITARAEDVKREMPLEGEAVPDLASALHLERQLVKAIKKYQFVRASTEVRDPDTWQTLEDLDSAVSHQVAVIEREFGILQSDGHHQAVFAINRQKVGEAVAILDAQVALARLALR